MSNGASSWQRILGKRGFQRSIMVLLFLYYPLLYYFGELIDYFGWEALRWDFFYAVHDIHRLFFLAPIIYAGYVFRVKGAVVTTLAAVIVFLPRALVLSPFPEPMTRMVVFTIFAGVLGTLTGAVFNEVERRRQVEALLKSQKDKLQGILDGMEEGVLIVGPDYKIRFLNSSMVKEFGEGVGSPCYKYLWGFDVPCEQICRLPQVISGRTEKWQYNFPDGRTYEILASPYVDTDGAISLLGRLRRLG